MAQAKTEDKAMSTHATHPTHAIHSTRATHSTQEFTEIPALAPDIAQKINALHAAAQRMERESRQKLDSAATAAWRAGKLLLGAKASIVRHGGHGAWMPWLETKFKGSARTARRYMKLARELPEAPAPDGLSLRQIYFRLGIATEPKAPKSSAPSPVAIARHIILANKLVRILRESQRAINPRDVTALYAQLRSLFEVADASPLS